MTDWEVLTLEQAGVTLLDCDHKTPAAREAGRPYVGIPQMTTGRVVFETARKISEEDYVHWTRKTKYQTDDVILSRRTNPGVTAVDDTGTDFALGQNLVLLRADGSRVRPDFLRWMVHTPQWWEQIDKYLNVGAVFSSLKCRDVPKFELTVPPIAEQQKINSILRPIADKIELNRRMNETLEEMARALFRDWFVDFGPTRRQADRATDPTAIMGHAFPAEIASALAPMFPATLGNDGLPEGWVSRALGDRVTVKRGGSPRPIKDFIRPTGIPWVKIADATRCNGPNLFVTREFIKKEGLKKTVELQPGSLILSNSATPGLPKFLRLRACIHDGWLYFPNTGGLSNEFLYLAFLHFKDAIVSQATGSVFNNLKTEVLKRQEFVFPPDQLINEFDGVIGPLFSKILANEQENQTLAEMRDLLLPQLISGEIRLKDAETLV